MPVLIVATTRMRNTVCVGALDLDSNRSLRLLDVHGGGFEPDVFAVGELWELEYLPAPEVTPPHVEDVVVVKRRRIGRSDALRTEIVNRVQPWRGDYTGLFDGVLGWTRNGSGYADERQLPNVSTGFWIPNIALEFRDGYYYHGDYHRLRYVGLADPAPIIAAGSLVRVSLARWWAPEGDNNQRCYLQLSGWY